MPRADASEKPAEAPLDREVTSKQSKILNLVEDLGLGNYRQLGVWGLAALLVVLIWWNWEDFRQRPFVGEVVAWIERDQLDPADSDRFTVAIARLENDLERKHEGLIFESLNEAFSTEDENAVQILRFDRIIERGGGDLEAAVAKAHQTARAYLDETGADVLIWGAVLGSGEESTPKLYWTPARDVDRARDWGRYETEDLALPEVFWTDLADILRLLVVTRDAEFQLLDGHFVADRLGPFVDKVRSLLTGGGPGWAADTRARVQLVLADSLVTVGRQAGLSEPFREAIDLYGKVLSHNTREKVPLDWAMTQNNRGNALRKLGERESGTERLELAVGAYRAALEEWTREKVPLNWARTQNNRGNALARLGERESGTERLELAVEAYRAALEERTREKVPLSWAMTQNNRGNALRKLGERESGTERLELAVGAYRAALEEWTRKKVPLNWATTQNNLGSALLRLGERRKEAPLVCDALGVHLVGWEVFSEAGASHYTTMAKNGIESDLAVLKHVAEAVEYEECIDRHRQALDAALGGEE